MLNLSYAEIDACLGAATGKHLSNVHAHTLYYDTRRISLTDNCIFVALDMGGSDGHLHVQTAYNKGIRNFIINQNCSLHMAPDCVIWRCENTLQALQTLATASRAKFKGLVVGITGSNGKTVVKEWMYQLLSGSMHVWRSPRSYNSQMGVALSLLQLDLQAKVAFFETGISKVGEMHKLHQMVKPHMAIFTHIGDAHAQGFANQEQKITEKCKLFDNVDVAILAQGIDKHYLQSHQANNALMKLITWHSNAKASYILKRTSKQGGGSLITVEHRTQEFEFWIPFTDTASIHNAMTCLRTLAALEQLGEDSLQRFKSLKSIENRLQISPGLRFNEIINDSYSNDLSALEIALSFLENKAENKDKVLILSDLDIEPEHNLLSISSINQLLSQHQLAKVFAIGSWLQTHALSLPSNVRYYTSAAQLIESGDLDAISNSVILIKGARKFELEKVSNNLVQKLHATRLQINLQAIANNIKQYKKALPNNTKLMGMIKATGYGTGDYEIAKLLQNEGADYLGVAFAAEGAELRKKEIHLPILVLNTQAEEIWTYRHYNLEPTLFSFESIEQYKAQFGNTSLNVHIELDSGMHRLGFQANQVHEIAQKLPPNFTVKGIFSHLAAAEDAHFDQLTANQITDFEQFANTLENLLGYTCIKHIANTAGIIRHPKAAFDMVRLGIGLYGIPAATEKTEIAAALYTTISQIKTINANQGIGYGFRNPQPQPRQIAIIPIGYADGFMRIASTQNSPWFVHINGKAAPIVGSICMDMCMIDVSNINCSVGDEVEIFGPTLPIEQLAQQCGTIAYEILSRIAPRVKRVYVQE